MVSFVSLGPGDPELITVKALRVLREADVVYCPATLGEDGVRRSLATDILKKVEPKLVDKIRPFDVPMSTDRRKALDCYRMIAEEIELDHRAGRRVCVTAEGDVGFYSSVHYVYELLRASGIPLQIVPGVPAFLSASACAGIHIAHGQQQLIVIPGNADEERLRGELERGNAVVVMKPSRRADMLRAFVGAHPEYKYQYAERVGMPDQLWTSDVAEIAHARFPYFSLLIISKEQ